MTILIKKFEKIQIEQDEFIEFGKFYSNYQSSNKSIILMILTLIFIDFIFNLKNFDLTKFIIASAIKAIILFPAFKYGLPNVVFPFIFKRAYKKIIEGKVTDLSISDDEITVESNLGKANYYIDKIEDITDLSKIIVIKFSKTASQIIPKRYFEDEKEVSDFIDSLNAKINSAHCITTNDEIDELKGDFKYIFKNLEFEFEDYISLINCRKIDYKSYLISLFITIFVSILCFDLLSDNIPFYFALIITLLIFAVTYWFFLAGLYIAFSIVFWFFNKKALDLPRSYNIYFDEIGSKSNGDKSYSQTDYSQMLFFKENRSSFAFSSSCFRVFILPKRYFANEVQISEFREFIRAHFDKAKLKK